MDSIRRQKYEGGDRQAVHEAVADQVEQFPERFLRRYLDVPSSLGGRFICADTFKETFDNYSQSKESRNRYNSPVHNAAAVLAAEQLRRVLGEGPTGHRPVVVMLTGIPGAGKTSSVLLDGSLPPGVHAIYEGQLADPAVALEKVEQVLQAGFRPSIVAVHVSPETALDNTLKRFHEIGRGASLATMARIQGGLPLGLHAVRERFGSRVDFQVIDRRNAFAPKQLVGWENVVILESEGNHEQISERLRQHLDARRPELSDEAYRQAAGLAPLFERDLGQRGAATGAQHAHAHDGRSSPGEGQQEAGLTAEVRRERVLLQEAATALGTSLNVVPVGENSRHVGPVVAASAELAVQAVGRGDVVVHWQANLSRPLGAAENVVTVAYREGRGQVSERTRDQRRDRGR